MQKLVWKNSIGDEIDLTGGNYGITEWEGFANTSLNIQSQQVPFQDGGVFLDALMEQRELSVTLAMNDGGNLETRYRLRRELIHSLNPKLGEGYLIYTNDFISKRIKCVAQIPLFETHNSNDAGTPKASLAWTACEPYWEDLEETEVELINGYNIIDNNGDIPAQIKLTIFSGAENPYILNQANQKVIVIDGQLENRTTINTNIGEKSVISEKMGFVWNNGGNFHGVANGSNKTVYVGSQIYTVDDYTGNGIAISFNLTAILNSIIYANNLFIAVGYHGIIITSQDGINWTRRTSGTSLNFYDVVYGNGLFVAVGERNAFATSTDGITWTLLESDTLYFSITYGNDLFVAVGASGAVRISSDGITWNRYTISGEPTMRGITYGNGLFVAVGNYGNVRTSPDGVTWTQRTSGVSDTLNNVGYCNNLFIAVGGTILTSLDGVTWTQRTSGVGVILNDVICKKGLYTICGAGGTILFSSNVIDWIVQTNTTTSDLKSISYGKGLFIAVGNSGTILTKEKQGKWITQNSGVNTDLNRITYGNGQFVVVGKNGLILLSSDGVVWSSQSSGVNVDLNGVTYGNNLFIAVGNSGTILTSSDGITWTAQSSTTSPISDNLRSVAYGNNLFIVVGENTTNYRSPDGITWIRNQGSGGGFATYNEVIYKQGIFVIVGSTGVINTSYDGIIWNPRYSGISDPLYSVAYGEHLFIAVGQNEILTSTDGITWTLLSRFSGYILYGIIYNENFVTVGSGGIIFNSNISSIGNLITSLDSNSDMTFNLEVGNNNILFYDENSKPAFLKYRQKYIGV